MMQIGIGPNFLNIHPIYYYFGVFRSRGRRV